jgi:vacuolar-type H+-ATPase subunit H
MPDELRQARWLLKEREDFIAEKTREADVLLEEVRVQAERMVQRTEIVRQANHVAQRILDDANEEARRLRHEVEDYADQKLASFEIVLDRTMKTVRAGREKLQVSPIPPVEIGEQGDTSLAASGSSLRPSGNPGALAAPDGAGPGIGAVEDPEGFFDQDLD